MSTIQKTALGMTLVFGCALAPNVVLAQPWLTSPSAVRQGDTTQVTGGGFAASQQVVLKVTNPSGTEDIQTVEADQTGGISSTLVLAEEGGYKAEAWEVGMLNQGEPLASSVSVAAPAGAE